MCHILSDMEASANPELLELDPNGRIVIPAALRRALNLKAGDKLVAWVNEGQLIIRSRAELVRELRAKFQRAPGEESLTRVLRRARDREVSHGVKR
jgi:AbrB family looped-hinge helix DNA binding protein